MQIQCECGKFRAQLEKLPHNTPGRLVCYCDDCQTYLHYLNRVDLLDPAGGTEVIPAYPSEIQILEGREVLRCLRLSPQGLYRWYTGCCNTPLANTTPGFPWVGILHRAYCVNDSGYLEKTFGPIKSRIQGRFAKGSPPSGTAAGIDFKGFITVLPFLLKGLLMGKGKASPFFQDDGQSPILPPQLLPLDERNAIRRRLGFKTM